MLDMETGIKAHILDFNIRWNDKGNVAGFGTLLCSTQPMTRVSFSEYDAVSRIDGLTDTSFYYGLKHLENGFRKKLRFGLSKVSNWNGGFERCMGDALDEYNGSSGYGKSILDDSKKYLPRK